MATMNHYFEIGGQDQQVSIVQKIMEEDKLLNLEKDELMQK